MKLKASVKKLNKRILFIAFAALGLVLTALRFYQMTSLIDPATGFFTDKGNPTVPLYYILWALTALGALLLFYLCPDCGTGSFAGQKNLPAAIGSLLMAVGAAAKAVSGWSAIRVKAGTSLLFYIRAEKAYIALLAVLFAMLSALVFLADAIAFATGKSFPNKLQLCHLIPVLWMFCTTVGYFSITVSYLNVTQLMLMIFADAFLMVFLFEFARFISGIGTEEASWLLFASGVITEIFLCAFVLPDLFMLVSGRSASIPENCALNLYDVTALLFVPTALFAAARNKEHTAIHLDPADETAEIETDTTQAATEETDQ